MSGINLVKHHSGIRVYVILPQSTESANFFLQGLFTPGKKLGDRFNRSVVAKDTYCTGPV